MKHVPVLAVFAIAGWLAPSVFAQAPLPAQPPPPPNAAAQNAPSYPPAEIERLVSPIALYPDPLLAQVLAAATFSEDIPDAAQWANEHHYLSGGQMAAAIAADRVPWDPSVQALLPFPTVLDMMASDMPWTQELGSAFLAQSADVMDAVQANRRKASSYGYLRSNGQVIVRNGPYVEILPVNPAFIVVPYYDPLIVFLPPRRGFAVVSAISFGFGVRLGVGFEPWGWGASRFGWQTHTLFINNAPWGRTWVNRAVYVHPYSVPRYRQAPRPPDGHRLVPRTSRERDDERAGRKGKEEHQR